MNDVLVDKWNDSYDRFENHILYPKEEVVKFLSRDVKRNLGNGKFYDILKPGSIGMIRGLDYGCGIGRITMLMNEFNIESNGVDISESAIKKAKKLFPSIRKNFSVVDGLSLPFSDSYFDISICESVIDSMYFKTAKKVINELDRVTSKLTFISFISGDDSKHFREFSGEEIVSTDHEKDTIQCWYNWSKINELIDGTNYKIKSGSLITEESLTRPYRYGRYYLVLSK